ncbi:CHASE2 domain-containing protein [Candidatus Reidiella endopervernicosa]|uniref:CHASE2 domain-containing protein n=1 Tax=Candidatus Reidiella endopervernicosa TaxID=2738883 RepID=A0A6N0HWE5_9GAMM|nr:CHASE2 domain-containing protein [Candidatus Reidiella endopervernicosa]
MGSGVITIPPDDDGVLRTMPLLYRVGPRLHPSLGLETLRVVAGVNNVSLHVTDEQGSGAVNGINTVQLGELIQITTRTDGAIPIHFHPYQASRYLSAHQLLSGKTDPSQISGHIVFIAATAKGLGDTIYTPLGDAVPGVEGHLQLVEQVLSGRSLTTPGWQSDLLLFVLLGIWIISSYMLSRFKPAWSVGLVVVTIAALFCSPGYSLPGSSYSSTRSSLTRRWAALYRHHGAALSGNRTRATLDTRCLLTLRLPNRVRYLHNIPNTSSWAVSIVTAPS